jgi:hypothetical protein
MLGATSRRLLLHGLGGNSAMAVGRARFNLPAVRPTPDLVHCTQMHVCKIMYNTITCHGPRSNQRAPALARRVHIAWGMCGHLKEQQQPPHPTTPLRRLGSITGHSQFMR